MFWHVFFQCQISKQGPSIEIVLVDDLDEDQMRWCVRIVVNQRVNQEEVQRVPRIH